MDGTVIKVRKDVYYVWVAVDLERMEVLSVRINRRKRSLEYNVKNKPIF